MKDQYAGQIAQVSPGYSTHGLTQGAMTNAPIESEVAYAGSRLGAALVRLEDSTSLLHSMLNPVLRQEPQAKDVGQGKIERHVTSKVGLGLMEAAERVDAIERRTVFILDMLAL